MSKVKQPLPLDFINGARDRWSFPNWQAGGDDSVYYNMHVPEFFKCAHATPVMEKRTLERGFYAAESSSTFDQIYLARLY